MIDRVVSQVRVRRLETALQFYEAGLGGNRLFVYEGFYAGIALGQSEIHLKCIEDVDPGIAYVQQSEHVTLYCWTPSLARALRHALDRKPSRKGREEAHDTPWGTREAILEDPDGHRIYLAEALDACSANARLLRGHWRQLLRTNSRELLGEVLYDKWCEEKSDFA